MPNRLRLHPRQLSLPARLSGSAALIVVAALMTASPALAKDEYFGYNGGEKPSGTMCKEGQACTADASEGGQYTASVTGRITEFTISHSTAGGSGQTVRLLVVKNDGSGTVEKASPVESLSATETIQTFHIPEAEQPHVERGQALEVTVTPTAGEKADSVIVKGSGDVVGCASAPSKQGEKIASCGGLGEPIYVNSADGVRAYVEDAVAPPEVVSYPSVTNITATSAELHARVKANDPGGHTTTARFEYGTVANNLNQLSPEQPVGSGEPGENEFNQSIGGLKPNTTYYYRVGVSNYEAATNSGWEYEYGAGSNEGVKSFTTPPAPPPTVALSPATNVGETTATLNGSVASNGLATKWKFEYGESQGYGAASAEGEVGSGSGATPQAASVNVAGLKPNTLYHYRIVATNPGGTTPSADGTFRTVAGKPPIVGAFVFSPLTPLSAYEVNLHFTVDPQGYATTFAVQWGTTTAYGNSDPGGPTAAVFGPQAYFWDAEYELSPGTTYHVRVVATNQWGTTTGPDFTFTTPRLTTTFLIDEFGMAPSNAVVPVNPRKPVLVLGKKFSCPPACSVTAEVEAVGKGGRKIKLGKAKFKVPKDKRKHKLEVRLPNKVKKLLAKNKKLHLKIKYKIANAKGKSTTIVSSLTLGEPKPHGHKRKR